MLRLAMGAATAAVLVLIATGPARAQPLGSTEPSTTSVEIPGAGAVAVLPRAWRTWQSEADGQPNSVWTTDLVSGWTCQLRTSQGPPSASAAAEALVEAPETVAIGASQSEPFEVPVGTAVQVTLGSPESDPPSRIQRLAYVDAPEGVVEVFCGPAPADHVIAVAQSIEPLTPGFSPEPFDPRIELAEHGFAVEFGPEWRVASASRVEYRTLLGGKSVLSVGREVTHPQVEEPAVDRCTMEDDSAVPGLTELRSVAEWQAAIRGAGKGMLHAKEPVMRVVELKSGPALRAEWPLKSGPTTAWIVSGHGHVVVLLCSSDQPPRDHWRSIAETIVFLPASG